jgi:hypothetical protein
MVEVFEAWSSDSSLTIYPVKNCGLLDGQPDRKAKLFLLVLISVLNEMSFRFDRNLSHVLLLCGYGRAAVHTALKHTSLAPHF